MQNEELLKDDLYLGLRRPRMRGAEYDSFVHNFVASARKLYPNAFIHFEDFGLHNARRILDKYRPEFSCFNDDIQGTGCVNLAAMVSGLHVSKIKLADVRIVVFGAGTAGTGIADNVRDAIATETGKSKKAAAMQIWYVTVMVPRVARLISPRCVDKPGLLLKSHGDKLTPAQKGYAHDDADWRDRDHANLFDVVKAVKPHVLIGTSTRPKAFTQEIVKEMAEHVERPIIFPLSNPTRLCEAEPRDINEWTKGKALIATGSPFPPVEYNGKKYDVGV